MMLASDARNARGEYIRWLHVFSMDPRSDSIATNTHTSFPWVWETQVPRIDELEALWHITKFDGLPTPWEECFWEEVRILVVDASRVELNGPYWMITRAPVISTVAQITSQLKREIAKEFFNRCSVKLFPTEAQSEALYRRLSPYLMIPTGDANETERTGQVRRRAVSQWHSAPFNRPPGSR